MKWLCKMREVTVGKCKDGEEKRAIRLEESKGCCWKDERRRKKKREAAEKRGCLGENREKTQ